MSAWVYASGRESSAAAAGAAPSGAAPSGGAAPGAAAPPPAAGPPPARPAPTPHPPHAWNDGLLTGLSNARIPVTTPLKKLYDSRKLADLGVAEAVVRAQRAAEGGAFDVPGKGACLLACAAPGCRAIDALMLCSRCERARYCGEEVRGASGGGGCALAPHAHATTRHTPNTHTPTRLYPLPD